MAIRKELLKQVADNEQTAVEEPIEKFSHDLIPAESKPLTIRTRFTKEMVLRAIEDKALPHEVLYAIATADPDVKFSDVIIFEGRAKQIERGPTMKERIDCAQALLPYYASKKPIEVAHQGQIEIIHAIAQSPLDAIELDDLGNVIDADFEEQLTDE